MPLYSSKCACTRGIHLFILLLMSERPWHNWGSARARLEDLVATMVGATSSLCLILFWISCLMSGVLGFITRGLSRWTTKISTKTSTAVLKSSLTGLTVSHGKACECAECRGSASHGDYCLCASCAQKHASDCACVGCMRRWTHSPNCVCGECR